MTGKHLAGAACRQLHNRFALSLPPYAAASSVPGPISGFAEGNKKRAWCLLCLTLCSLWLDPVPGWLDKSSPYTCKLSIYFSNLSI